MIFEKKIVDIFRKQFMSRCDDTGKAYYFSTEDFPGLRKLLPQRRSSRRRLQSNHISS